MNRDRIFRGSLALAAIGVTVILLIMALSLVWGAMPALRKFGLAFFWGSTWNPAPSLDAYGQFPFTSYPPFVGIWLVQMFKEGVYGGLPFLVGTMITSLLALALSLPFSFSLALLLGEFRRTGWFASLLKSLVDLISAVPSVIYGFWGLMFLVPLLQEFQMKMGIQQIGANVLSASLILAVMIIPNAASLSREVISMVPHDLKEAAYAMGATRLEVIRRVVIPYARSGILAGILLSLGRALGETMAVTMVIGNLNEIPKSLFSPANTMASVIANELAEAAGTHYSALIAIGLELFLVTTVINVIGTWVIRKMSVTA